MWSFLESSDHIVPVYRPRVISVNTSKETVQHSVYLTLYNTAAN